MPDIESVLFTRLTGFAGLTALINKRVYPLVMPQAEGLEKKLPCIVYQKITGRHIYSHGGESNLTRSRYQFSCYAKTHVSAWNVTRQLQAALSAWSDMTVTPAVFVCFLEMEMDLYDSTIETFRVIADYAIWHEES